MIFIWAPEIIRKMGTVSIWNLLIITNCVFHVLREVGYLGEKRKKKKFPSTLHKWHETLVVFSGSRPNDGPHLKCKILKHHCAKLLWFGKKGQLRFINIRMYLSYIQHKGLEIVCISEVTIWSWFDIGTSFKDPESVYSTRSLEMILQQTYRGCQGFCFVLFYVGWISGTLIYGWFPLLWKKGSGFKVST